MTIYRDCLHCGQQLRVKAKPGQPPKLHDECRREHKLAQDRERAARNKRKAKAGVAEKLEPRRRSKICSTCSNLAHRRELSGCSGCGMGYSEDQRGGCAGKSDEPTQNTR